MTENIAGVHKIVSSVSLGPAFISAAFQTFSIFLNAAKICYSTFFYRIMNTRNIEVKQKNRGKRECVYLLLPSFRKRYLRRSVQASFFSLNCIS